MNKDCLTYKNTGCPRYPRTFYLQFVLFTLAKLVKNASFLVKNGYFLVKMNFFENSIFAVQNNNVSSANNEGNL